MDEWKQKIKKVYDRSRRPFGRMMQEMTLLVGTGSVQALSNLPLSS